MADAIALSSHTATINTIYAQLENWAKQQYFLETIIILSIPTCIWGLIGNGVDFWLLCFRIKRTRFSVYILNLTAADLIVNIYYIMVFIIFLAQIYVNLYFSCVMEIIYLFGYNTSIYLVTALTAERYLTVFFPVWYQRHRLKYLSIIVCAVLWPFSCLVSLVAYISCYPRFLSFHNEERADCTAATIFEITVTLLVFQPIMLFSTVALCVKMQREAKQSAPARLDITITILAVVFLIFSFSIRTVDAIAYWYQTLDSPVPFLLSLLFDSIKSSINPFIYLAVGCWKRVKPIHMFLERALSGKAERTQVDQEETEKHPEPQM
ncbi:proto-oncogene Mas-like [Podarcis raffonei]|uniref:proto-oncogene Mas-like n=1 Tax=Podarcis raffonei TaxID=65483 RepID=UPI00232919C7|nr:proto-oncogene Mas-like [Podarcis raffonei]XP_053238297.1 proto-oncogene Mas-like [Podarcis raffonei]XP_053238299.1 proto-oncogene Mas-like [Podarcis raffonei]XP_053238300.1 proto-oncogene Mas-like [Podarcis raffonei]XP_053238301.1 proto-oncogene Mas-like [Podarcis raffonei]